MSPIQTVFVIKTVAGSTVVLTPPYIECMATYDWGTSVYMASGTRWDTSETLDALLERMLKFTTESAQ